jgi:hypothetical protein
MAQRFRRKQKIGDELKKKAVENKKGRKGKK